MAGRLSYPLMDQLRSVDPQALADRAERRDYSALASLSAVSSRCRSRPRDARAVTMATYAARPMATSRRARLLCRLSLGVGTARREAEEGWVRRDHEKVLATCGATRVLACLRGRVASAGGIHDARPSTSLANTWTLFPLAQTSSVDGFTFSRPHRRRAGAFLLL
jgi:hypothetical protein